MVDRPAAGRVAGNRPRPRAAWWVVSTPAWSPRVEPDRDWRGHAGPPARLKCGHLLRRHDRCDLLIQRGQGGPGRFGHVVADRIDDIDHCPLGRQLRFVRRRHHPLPGIFDALLIGRPDRYLRKLETGQLLGWVVVRWIGAANWIMRRRSKNSSSSSGFSGERCG